MDNKDLYNKIKYLFGRYWDEDLSDDEEDKLYSIADEVLTDYEWTEVFSSTLKYLHNECISPEDVINFAHLYWIYGWYENDIADPYKFLGYMYYRIDLKVDEYDDMDILDSLATTILPRAGYSNADLLLNTQYMPESDPKILEEVENYKSLENHK